MGSCSEKESLSCLYDHKSDTEHMVHYDYDCGLMDWDCKFHTLLHRVLHDLDIRSSIASIVDQEVNTADQLQLLHDHTMIHLHIQSRWYLLHRDK